MPDPTLFQLSPTYDLPRLKSLPLREQPVFRVAQNAAACNLSELLAAMIGGPKQIEIADALLARYGGDLRRMHQAHVAELMRIKGVSPQVAARIKAGLALGLRLNKPTDDRPTINTPADAAELVLSEMSLLEKEQLRVILLDTRNHVVDIVLIYEGSVNPSQVRIAEVFKPAVARMASAIIVVHCHPSGDPTPSPDDVSVTRAIVQAGKLLDVSCLDHIVIGQSRWVSLKERNLGFS